MLGTWSYISFEQPYFFFLFLFFPFFIWLKWKKKIRVSSIRLNIPQLSSLQESPKRKIANKLFPILGVLAISGMILAMAKPQVPLREEIIKQDGIAIVIAIDVSASMLAKDFKPNRLEVCKQVASEFIDKRKYDQIGVVVFAGEALPKCPITNDHNTLSNILQTIQYGELEDGTAIGMGLSTAMNRLKQCKAKSRVIILLTDGEDDGKGYVLPFEAAQVAQQLGIRIYTIGVGKIGNALSPSYLNQDGTMEFEMKTVSIDEALLKAIAEKSNRGAYYRAKDNTELTQIYNEIDDLEKTTYQSNIFKQKKNVALPYLVFSLIILLLSYGLNKTIFRTFP